MRDRGTDGGRRSPPARSRPDPQFLRAPRFSRRTSRVDLLPGVLGVINKIASARCPAPALPSPSVRPPRTSSRGVRGPSPDSGDAGVQEPVTAPHRPAHGELWAEWRRRGRPAQRRGDELGCGPAAPAEQLGGGCVHQVWPCQEWLPSLRPRPGQA